MEFNSVIKFFVVITFVSAKSYAKIGLTTKEVNLAAHSGEQHCQEACLQKFTLDATACLTAPACSKCWDACTSITNSNKASDNMLLLRIASMIKQEFLVSTHLAWAPSDILVNCLVTWEVYGGGLMGNLLTDSSNVELSLWPETKYRVQVTCKNKLTKQKIKSPPLVINTSNALDIKPEPPSTNTKLIPIVNATSTFDSEKWENLIPTVHHSKLNKLYPGQGSSIILGMHQNIKEIVLGICAALIVFLFILTLFCAFRGNTVNDKIDYYLSEISVNTNR